MKVGHPDSSARSAVGFWVAIYLCNAGSKPIGDASKNIFYWKANKFFLYQYVSMVWLSHSRRSGFTGYFLSERGQLPWLPPPLQRQSASKKQNCLTKQNCQAWHLLGHYLASKPKPYDAKTVTLDMFFYLYSKHIHKILCLQIRFLSTSFFCKASLTLPVHVAMTTPCCPWIAVLHLQRLQILSTSFALHLKTYLSRPMAKPTICIGGNKGADQRLCFRYSDSTIPPLLNSKISSF